MLKDGLPLLEKKKKKRPSVQSAEEDHSPPKALLKQWDHSVFSAGVYQNPELCYAVELPVCYQ